MLIVPPRLALALLALSSALAPAAALAQSSPVTSSGGVARYTVPGLPAAIYLTLANRGNSAVSLVGASSPACSRLMLHQTMNANGMSMMADSAALPIPGNGSVTLAPGGYHLMCEDPNMTVGQQVSVILTFTGAPALTVSVPVKSAGGP